MNMSAIKEDFPGSSLQSQALTTQVLGRENQRFKDSAGVSGKNREWGFKPAFFDTQNGGIYISRFADGRPASVHVLDGLPPQLVIARTENGHVRSIKASVISGFVRNGQFYTRDQAARTVSTGIF